MLHVMHSSFFILQKQYADVFILHWSTQPNMPIILLFQAKQQWHMVLIPFVTDAFLLYMQNSVSGACGKTELLKLDILLASELQEASINPRKLELLE